MFELNKGNFNVRELHLIFGYLVLTKCESYCNDLFSMCYFSFSPNTHKRGRIHYVELVIAHSSLNILQNLICIESKVPLILRCTIILCTPYNERKETHNYTITQSVVSFIMMKTMLKYRKICILESIK